MTTPSSLDLHGVPEDVLASLAARVAEIERTQNEEDVDGFLALFAEEATWVTGDGHRLNGLAEISLFTASVLPGAFAEGSVSYELELVRVITPEVAVTGVLQSYVDGSGTRTGVGAPTYVWQLVGGKWLIAVGQNTTRSPG